MYFITAREFSVLQDLHLGIEIVIETVFDCFHKLAHIILSPSQAFKLLFWWCFSNNNDSVKEDCGSESQVPVPTSMLGDNDPIPTERSTTFHDSLNTDARTCQDVITELG